MNRFDLDQKISVHLAFIFILVLSFLVAWFSLSSGKKIMEYSKNSAVFDINQRMNQNISSLKTNKR